MQPPVPAFYDPLPVGYEHISHGAARLLKFLQINLGACQFTQDLALWDNKKGQLHEFFCFTQYGKKVNFPYFGFFLDDHVCFLTMGPSCHTLVTAPAVPFRDCINALPSNIKISHTKPANALPVVFQWNSPQKKLEIMHAGHKLGHLGFELYKMEEGHTYYNAILDEGEPVIWAAAYVQEAALQEQDKLKRQTVLAHQPASPTIKL